MSSVVPRFAQQRLRERVAAFRVVIVNGPRQAGKTTLLNLFHDDHGGSFRSLDDATTLMVARADPTEFARYGAAPRVIDEIQRGGDDLVLAIKYLVDRDNSKGQFVLSGSTRFLTVPTLSESLVLQVDIDALAAPGHPTTGILVESFAYAELTRLLAASDLGATLYFYRDRAGREIDFLLERRNGQAVAIQVKASSTVGPEDFRHLRWLAEWASPATVPAGQGPGVL